MPQVSIILSAVLFLFVSVNAEEPVIGGPCQGCEYVFIDQPENINNQARIAPINAQGEPLELSGTVYDANQKPVADVIVYAYQTDAQGIYPEGKTRHGSLRAWVRTDKLGNYTFTTIRPGSYPGRQIPQHIHLHIIEPGKATYYIDDVTFSDDPLLKEKNESQRNCRGGCGLSTPQKHQNGVWHARRDIILGDNISGYQEIPH